MIRRLRERLNLFLYDTKGTMMRILSTLHLIVSLSAIGLLVYYYGYPQTAASESDLFKLIQGTFAFYILRFIIKLIYDFHPLAYIRQNWLEALLLLLLAVEGIAYNMFDTLLIGPLFESMGFENFDDISTITIQLFFFVYLIVDIFKSSRFIPRLKLHPALIFMISISGLTLTGAGLLMLPEMTRATGGLNFTDSLFTAMSAVSVTGLTTVDVATEFSQKGQVVILFLIQLGGLNTIAFGAFVYLMAKFGVGVKQHEVIEDFVNKESIFSTRSMFGKIILWSLIIEVVGTGLIYLFLEPKGIFASEQDRFFHSVFHAISGFNNAGLSTVPGGMNHALFASNIFVQSIIMVLFFLGGLGMIYVFDLFEIRRLRERMKNPWRSIEFGTKLSLYTTLWLLLAGAVVFIIFEWDGVMAGEGIHQKVISSLFHSMTTRNAGFSFVDVSQLALPVFVVFLFLMFVGASSGSAGGGIRTSTFAILVASVISTIRGRKNIELFKRTIDNNLVLKAFTITLFFIMGNFLGIFALTITEQDALATGAFTINDVIFEHVSAASTVGLSTGITPDVSMAGKYVLIIAMFIGRVGTLTVAYLIGKRVITNRYKYPEGHTMIG